MTPAITPTEVEAQTGAASRRDVPDEVFQAFNAVIVRNFDSKLGQSRVKVREVIGEIRSRLSVRSDTIHQKMWLHMEDYYRETGWDVCCKYSSGLGYKNWEPYFIFQKH